MNIQRAQTLLQQLADLGVTEFCLCAGARNSPLVVSLEKCEGAQIYHFFEERSAAFFALGRIQESGKPVAVITTSGTAVAELLPACIEAHYSGWPLILVSADRPKSYRGTGSPQTIEQVGIFSSYVEKVLDLSDTELNFAELENWSYQAPLHLNICFDEPLIDSQVVAWKLNATKVSRTHLPAEAVSEITLQRPVVVVGALSKTEAVHVLPFLLQWQSPIYAESHSQLRQLPELQDLLLKGGEKAVQELVQNRVCETVLRLGGVPTLRLWRDLESKLASIPVTSVSRTGFSGLSRPSNNLKSWDHLKNLQVVSADNIKWSAVDLNHQKQLATAVEKFPLSEVAQIRKLSKRIGTESLYLGNSLPIREWDLASIFESGASAVYAHRGANGIDGQISGFLGITQNNEAKAHWAVIGDLTAMYDLASLWITPQLQPTKRRLVIVNNQGGQIFRNIFQKEIFLNRHSIEFSDWARMWKWDYLRVISTEEIPQNLPQNIVIELVPDSVQSEKFWNSYHK